MSSLALEACQRTPEEPLANTSAAPSPPSPPSPGASVPAARAARAATAVTAGAGGRCVRPTSPASPKPVAPGPAAGCPADPLASLPKLPVLPVTFPEANGVTVQAELAATEDTIMRGLMFRKQMPEEHGMLFRLGRREDHHFWMRNTCIPLDMLFIEDDGLIVGIEENVPTLNDDERFVGCPSSWVLEVNAGWSRRHGVRAGQKLVLPR